MALIGLAMAGLGLALGPFGSWQIGVMAVGIMAIAAAVPLYLNYNQGLKGEKRAIKALDSLPDEFTAIANWTNGSGKGGDTDVLVIGPSAVLALEIKTWSFAALLENDKCYQVYENGYRKAIMSPIAQAKRNAKAAGKALQSAGLEVTVQPIVVFNNHEDITVIDCTIPVIRRKHLVTYVRDIEGSISIDTKLAVQVLAGKDLRQTTNLTSPIPHPRKDVAW